MVQQQHRISEESTGTCGYRNMKWMVQHFYGLCNKRFNIMKMTVNVCSGKQERFKGCPLIKDMIMCEEWFLGYPNYRDTKK